MSPSDKISDEDLAKSPFHGKATARIAQETGDPLANVDKETEALKALAQKLIELPDGEAPSQELIQEGLDALTKLYTVRFREGERWDPFPNGRLRCQLLLS